jgi:hypothetical protein
MVEGSPSLREFLDGGGNPLSIPNLRDIVREIIKYRIDYSTVTLQSLADQLDIEASNLERGVDHELRVWDGDDWLVYDVIPATPESARLARWVSDGLRDSALADALLALLPPAELSEIRRQMARPGST